MISLILSPPVLLCIGRDPWGFFKLERCTGTEICPRLHPSLQCLSPSPSVVPARLHRGWSSSVHWCEQCNTNWPHCGSVQWASWWGRPQNWCMIGARVIPHSEPWTMHRVTLIQTAVWSWKVMELGRPFSRPGKSWKLATVMEKSWKMMIMSWNFNYCTE